MHSTRKLLSLMLLLSAITLAGQHNFWNPIEESGTRFPKDKRQIIPKKYQVYHLNFESFVREINTWKERNNSSEFRLDFPHPDGNIRSYRMVETQVFTPELMAKYPGFTSFTGRCTENGSEYLKMSISPFSIHVMITGAGDNTVFIDPYAQGSLDTYVVYYKRDYEQSSLSKRFFCGVTHDEQSHQNFEIPENTRKNLLNERQPGDCSFRTYRLALACTGEYAQFHGGTIERVLDAYNVAMTRVNGVYEKELALTMVLIPDTDKLIFLNATTDPYTNNNGSTMLGQNQTTINNIIGFNNYDIGHVFSTGGGGIASLGSPCTNRKAQGVTGQSSPVNDPFTIDYVAHEMGHQFGANHTQNNSCQRNSSTAMEPGSGSTIMGYAGICDPNVQNNSNDYFHAVSLGEMSNFVTIGAGATCGDVIEIENSKPQVSVLKTNYSMPVSTAFYLTSQGSDEDGDMLTYTWEQMDSQTATMPPQAGNVSGPAFRSLPPSVNPTRFFPDLQRRFNTWEVLPSVSRTMRFRCTVRDNNPLGGCTDEVNVQLNFTNQAGPFLVTNPNTGNVEWRVGSSQSVTWNVANTDVAPIECSLVTILLSSDGGTTYPDTLATDVPNTGSYEIIVPNRVTTRARIMVIAQDHIFFDVSNFNFRISSSFNLTTPLARIEVCDTTAPVQVALSLSKFITPEVLVSLSATSITEGLTFEFSDPNPSAPASVNVFISGLENLAIGDNPVTITAQSALEQIQLNFSLFRSIDEIPDLLQLTPANYANVFSRFNVRFECAAVPGIPEYEFEISTNPDFTGTVTKLKSSTGRVNTTLVDRTVYYWRVRALSSCGDGAFTGFFTFRTGSGNPAVLLANKQILINPGETRIITEKELNAVGTPQEQVRFVVTQLPQYGFISLGDSIVSNPGFIFTLSDINEGLLRYNHGGGEDEFDNFVFNLINPDGLWLPNNRFNIRIRQSNLGLEAFTFSDVLCNGDSTGQIFADVFGGTPPYTYSLDGVMFSDSTILENLPKGNYTVFVQDQTESVVKSETVIITEPTPLLLTLQREAYNIRAAVSGGVGNYSFSLNGATYIPENIFTDPGNQLHIISVKDGNSCVVTDSLEISIEPLDIEVSYENAVCPGDSIDYNITVRGGIPPYNYNFNENPFTSSEVFSLPAGIFVFAVRDSGNKIVFSDTIITTEPDSLELAVETDRYLATFLPSNNAGKLEFSLDGINFDSLNSSVFEKSGNYVVYVRNESGCISTSEFVINVLDTAFYFSEDLICNGDQNGRLSVSVPYGVHPFSFIVETPEQQSIKLDTIVLDNLSGGNYTIHITDSREDTFSFEVYIFEPEALVLNTALDGDSLIFLAEGGTKPYQYSIDGGINFFDFDTFPDLPDNTYEISVKDKNNCTVNTTVTISVSTSDFNYNADDISIYPNPNNGIFIVNLNTHLYETGILSILNPLGQFVFQKKITAADLDSGILQVEAGNLSKGIYVLKFNNSKINISKSIIISH